LQEAICRIKVSFNREFDEVFVKKELEIAKIKERNKRIRTILDDIGANDPVYEPEMGSTEKPEMLLTTTDDEVLSVCLTSSSSYHHHHHHHRCRHRYLHYLFASITG